MTDPFVKEEDEKAEEDKKDGSDGMPIFTGNIMPGRVVEPCKWKRLTGNSITDIWKTGCGREYVEYVESPSYGYMNYCPYCGGAVVNASTWKR